jgi:ABC-2 type transport system ATP-binding protein
MPAERPALAAPDAAIRVERVTRRFKGVTALDDVSLSVAAGSSCALLGPNGAGKTTLIAILCTLQRADAGSAFIAGIDVARRPTAARRSIGVVFQDSSLDDRLTAEENLDFHGLVYGMRRRERVRRIDEVLALFELEDWREAPVRTFSGGMKRRLEIGRALMHDPRVLFLDEPSAGLDAQTRRRIWHYLADLQRRRDLTLFVTTHYIEEVEGCDQVCILDHGRILADGPPAALRRRHGGQVLTLMPQDAATRAEIRALYPAARDLDGGRLRLEVPDGAAVDGFLDRFTRLREIGIEAPSLEGVFLAMTGRDLRDREAGRHEAEALDGRQAGRS